MPSYGLPSTLPSLLEPTSLLSAKPVLKEVRHTHHTSLRSTQHAARMEGFWKPVLLRASATRKSRQRYNSRPFYLVLVVLVFLAALTLFARPPGGTVISPGASNLKRRSAIHYQELAGLAEDEHEVRLHLLCYIVVMDSG